LKWKDKTNCLVDCLGHGQEFILNAEDNPKLVNWAVDLIENHGTDLEKKSESTLTKIDKKTYRN